MNFLIKVFLIRRSHQQGFAIPMAIALGLIMLLIGTINIFKSNDEELTAIGQRGTQIALAAAEAGIASYKNLIENNRAIAVYSSASWSTSAASIPGITINCGFAGSGATAVQNAATSSWQNINGGIGQFRLIDYSYSYADDVGTLVVEGRDGNTGINASVARLRVDIPVQSGLPRPLGAPNDEVSDNLNNFDPALWIGSQTFTLNAGNDNLDVNGNILISKSDCQLSSGMTTIVNALGNATAEPRSLIATPNPPDVTPVGSPNGTAPFYGSTTPGDSDYNSKLNVVKNNDINNKVLPRTGDKYEVINSNNVYHYLVEDELNLGDGDTLGIVDGTKVVLYVQGNITFNGEIDVNCNDANNNNICEDSAGNEPSPNTSDSLEIYGNSALSGSNQFGCATGVTCPTSTITFDGAGKTINVKAFIHAPDAEVRVTNNNPTVNITGAMWVQEWNDQSSATPKVTITSDDRYYHYNSVRSLNGNNTLIVKPIVYPPSNWTTEEVP